MSGLIRREDIPYIDLNSDMPQSKVRVWVAFKEQIDALPSADRPTGKWIKSNLLPHGWHCSHCDSPVMTDDIEEMLYCPNCGARMRGEEEC